MNRPSQRTTRNVRLSIVFVPVLRVKDRVTRPMSKTVEVKATRSGSPTLLLVSSFFSRGQRRSRMTRANQKLCERRLTRKAGNRESPFSLNFACVSLMVASPSYMDSETSRTSFTSWTSRVSSSFSTDEAKSSISQLFHQRGQIVHFPRTIPPPRSFGHLSRETLNIPFVRHEVYETLPGAIVLLPI